MSVELLWIGEMKLTMKTLIHKIPQTVKFVAFGVKVTDFIRVEGKTSADVYAKRGSFAIG